MKTLFRSASIVLLLLVSGARAANTNMPVEIVRMPTNDWLHIGEMLTYRVYWGYLPVGVSYVTTSWTNHDGRQLIAVRYRTLSNKLVATLYPVDDLIEALIDTNGFKSVRFTKSLKEGTHKYLEVTTFDYTNNTAHWVSHLHNKRKTMPLEAGTRDIVAFMYLMRGFPFQPDTTTRYRVYADTKTYDVWLTTRGREKIKLPHYGKVPSIKLEPEAAFQGLFVRKGKITAWVSEDSRRLCTRLVGSVPVASINVILVDVQGPGNDAWIRNAPPRDDVPSLGQ